MRLSLSLLLLLFGSSQVAAFSTTPTASKAPIRLYAESSPSSSPAIITDESSTGSTEDPSKRPSTIYVPLSFDEMVKQVSSAMEDAMKANKRRQILRILLPRSSDNAQFGTYYETNVVDPDPSIYADTILVPPDETWQGGIMQLYRAASLACQEILRCVYNIT